MSTIPSWLDDPVAWQTLYFGIQGNPAPGLARVTARQHNKVQKNAGPGINGGSIVDQGSELTAFEVELRVWDRDGFGHLETFIKTILPSIKPKTAHTVAHPVFALYQCSQIYIEGFGGGEPVDWVATFKFTCCRWVKPKPKSVTSKVVAEAPTKTFGGLDGKGPIVPSPFTFPSPTDRLPPISLKP